MRPFALVLVVFLGCGDDKAQPAPEETSGGVAEAPADPPPEPAAAAPAANRGEVALALSGVIEGSFEGRAAECGAFTIEGKEGGSVKVRSAELGDDGDWDLTLIATTDSEWDRPSMMLNVRGDQRASYVWHRKLPEGESVALHRDGSGAELDLTLRDVVGTSTVKVTGTMRCP